MRVVVALEQRFEQTPDGRIWAVGGLDSSFWKRYLEVFDEVRVVARVRQVAEPPANAKPADGPGVSFFPLPYYIGPWQFARHYFRLRRVVRQAVSPDDAVILRVPGQIGTLVERSLRKSGHPFAVEVVGDPQDSLGPATVNSLLRPLARWSATRQLKSQCQAAEATSYVTRSALQRRYPPAPDAYTTHYSSIDLRECAYMEKPRTEFRGAHRLIFVGTLSVLYKAPDVLIRAFASCPNAEHLHLTIVGDGAHRAVLETLASSLGVGRRVDFVGSVPGGEAVRAVLDSADLFVLPSRQEGLPRAMIEAMARALPCIGSTVGGIPELLPPEDMVAPNDVSALSHKISEMIRDPMRLAAASARNLETSRTYSAPILQDRRLEFYREVADISTNRPACSVAPAAGNGWSHHAI